MNKVYQLPSAVKQVLSDCRQKNCQLVLVTGVFDLLHHGHLHFLGQAKKEGDCLLIGVETDERVKKLKGKDRPIHGQQERVAQLEATGLAEAVFVLPPKFDSSQDHLQLLQLIKPKVLAVSASTPKLKQKQQLVRRVGAELKIVCEHDASVSTTQILNQKK